MQGRGGSLVIVSRYGKVASVVVGGDVELGVAIVEVEHVHVLATIEYVLVVLAEDATSTVLVLAGEGTVLEDRVVVLDVAAESLRIGRVHTAEQRLLLIAIVIVLEQIPAVASRQSATLTVLAMSLVVDADLLASDLLLIALVGVLLRIIFSCSSCIMVVLLIVPTACSEAATAEPDSVGTGLTHVGLLDFERTICILLHVLPVDVSIDVLGHLLILLSRESLRTMRHVELVDMASAQHDFWSLTDSIVKGATIFETHSKAILVLDVVRHVLAGTHRCSAHPCAE